MRAKILFSAVIAIIGVVVGVAAIATTVTIEACRDRHPDAKVAYCLNCEFPKNKDNVYGDVDLKSGSIEIGALQKTGKSYNMYTVSVKKGKSKNYDYIKTITFPNNNEYKGDYTVMKSSKKASYTIVVEKISDTNTASEMYVDIMAK